MYGLKVDVVQMKIFFFQFIFLKINPNANIESIVFPNMYDLKVKGVQMVSHYFNSFS